MSGTDRKSSLSELFSVTMVTELDRHPAHVYLAGLGKGSRPAMTRALDVVAEIASGGNADHLTLDWAALRYQHTAAIRAELIERYAASTVNKTLSALRGVLKQAWKLELMTAEDYYRAVALEGLKGERVPPGRARRLEPAGQRINNELADERI